MDEPPDDGAPTRPAGPWTKDKLEIIRRYLERFGTACKNKAPTFYFVDAFAGPGINTIEKKRYWGSPLLALKSEPRFAKCLLMDYDERNVDLLRYRTDSFGKRAVVMRGDSNRDLLPAMHKAFNRGNPALCLLDPEGAELEWRTIADLSRFRRGPRRVEQLILFPTNTGFIRMLPVSGDIAPWAEEKMNWMFGHEGWREIWERRRLSNDTDRATTEYVRLYADGLRELGYATVLDREIRHGGFRGPLMYFLLFATDHPLGETIMDRIFDKVEESHQDEGQPRLPGFTMPRRKRLP